MDELLERYGPGRLWAIAVALLAMLVVLGAMAFPQRVYVEIIWQYYWGPVVADANGWSCVAWADGAEVACTDAGTNSGPTASPGYTWQSYAGYIPILLLLMVGFLFVLERLDIDRYRGTFYALFPWMLFGGALRTVEDANVATGDAGEMVISLPWSAIIISPFIYVTVAVLALASLVVSVWLDRRGHIPKYEYGLAALGTAALGIALAALSYLWTQGDTQGWFPLIAIVTFVGAVTITAVVWVLLESFAPQVNRGTGYMGVIVILAHSVDGVANLIGLTYATAFGWPYNLSPKHPINAAIVDFFGNAWPFLAVKIVAAVFIIWVFNEEIFEESPRFAYLLLITAVAVGLGPGTRDVLRATFGV